jgi:hypothetical protein
METLYRDRAKYTGNDFAHQVCTFWYHFQENDFPIAYQDFAKFIEVAEEFN